MIPSFLSYKAKLQQESITSKVFPKKKKAKSSVLQLIKKELLLIKTESNILLSFYHILINFLLYYRAKSEYLATPPNINNPGIKGHEKYKNFVDTVNSANRSEVKAWIWWEGLP